ncbi:MAG: helix-turn-helix domain-containing protein [Ruminococcaceae bacterium]|nr:helix-turn-helix domain-containing protein [Oscillospiraceae bacterium]
MTLFGYTLRFLRGRNKLTLSELSRELDLGITTLENIEDGYIEPEEDAARRIADYFGVTVSYMKGSAELHLVKSDETEAMHTPQRFVRLRPVVLPFSDAERELRQGGPPTEIILPLPAGDRSDYVAVRATDNSMIRYRVMAGDTLVVRRDPLQIRDGDLVLLCTESGQTMLRLYYCQGEDVLLRSDEDDLLPPLRLSECDKSLRLIGTVVQIRIDADREFVRRQAQNPAQLPEEILPPPDIETLEGSGSLAAYKFDYGFETDRK